MCDGLALAAEPGHVPGKDRYPDDSSGFTKLKRELKRETGSIDSDTGVTMQVVNGESFRASQETGPKAKGKRVVFRTFDGLVQHRIESALRCAPANSILWRLGIVILPPLLA
jgi:hypothetical protein